jgi:acetyl esterase
MGSLATHDPICREFAKKAGVLVVAVAYRLAPENPYPAGFDDSYTALEWVSKNIKSYQGDPTRIALGGDSAGGNLAAAVAIKARDISGPNIRCQVLLYPVTNPAHMDTESHLIFANGYGLTHAHMVFFQAAYLPKESDRFNVYASPLLAENLKNLPPAVIITAGFDVLRDEGKAYANRLSQAGNQVETIHYPGMIHGFATMGRIFPQASDAVTRASQAMRIILSCKN